MQCKLKEKWILSVCMEKLQADERMREKEIDDKGNYDKGKGVDGA